MKKILWKGIVWKIYLKGRRMKIFLWKGIVLKISLKWHWMNKIALNGIEWKTFLEMALCEKNSLKGHCMNFIWNGVVRKKFLERRKILFKTALYERISLKECCSWEGIVWLFFEKNSLKGRCVKKNFDERALYKKILWKKQLLAQAASLCLIYHC